MNWWEQRNEGYAMNTLIGMAVGILATGVLVITCAAISALVYYNTSPISLYVGIALGVMLVAAIVGYLA
jgi:hypothetical protein